MKQRNAYLVRTGVEMEKVDFNDSFGKKSGFSSSLATSAGELEAKQAVMRPAMDMVHTLLKDVQEHQPPSSVRELHSAYTRFVGTSCEPVLRLEALFGQMVTAMKRSDLNDLQKMAEVQKIMLEMQQYQVQQETTKKALQNDVVSRYTAALLQVMQQNPQIPQERFKEIIPDIHKPGQ